MLEHGYLHTEDNLAGNPILGEGSHESGLSVSCMVRINGGETQMESAELIARSDAEGQWQITRKIWVSHAPSHAFSSYNNAGAV